MTIECDEGEWWLSCDKCSDSHDLDAQSFAEAVSEVWECGWKGRKLEDGSYEHICPSCQETEREAINNGW